MNSQNKNDIAESKALFFFFFKGTNTHHLLMLNALLSSDVWSSGIILFALNHEVSQVTTIYQEFPTRDSEVTT